MTPWSHSRLGKISSKLELEPWLVPKTRPKHRLHRLLLLLPHDHGPKGTVSQFAGFCIQQHCSSNCECLVVVGWLDGCHVEACRKILIKLKTMSALMMLVMTIMSTLHHNLLSWNYVFDELILQQQDLDANENSTKWKCTYYFSTLPYLPSPYHITTYGRQTDKL